MKVLTFSDTLWPEGGGGQLATYLYTSLLREEGVDIVVIAWKLRGEYRYPFQVIKVSNIGYGKYSLPLVSRVKKLLMECDLVYLTPEPLTLVPFINKYGKPIVVHIHSYYPTCPIGHLYNFSNNQICSLNVRSCRRCIWIYESTRKNYAYSFVSSLLNTTAGRAFARYLSRVSAVIFVSNEQRRLFLRNTLEPFNISRCYVIYNPLPNLEPLPMEGDDVGFFGGLDPIKGFSYLYKAWKNVRLKHPSCKLHVALASQLHSEVERVGIMRHGLLKGSYYEDVYSKIRCVVLPSICPEPSPYVAMEACLRGRILVASNIGGIHEIMKGLDGVILVKPKDIGGLTEAISQVLSMDRNEAVELGFKNREGILKKFDSRRSAKELLTVLDKLL